MNVLRFDSQKGALVGEFDSRGARTQELAHGNGEAHAFVVRFEPGGVIGPHAAGFGQLLVPVQGTGWIAGTDGERHPLRPGEAAFIGKGETHSKGSDRGMTAVMVQMSEFTSDVLGPAV